MEAEADTDADGVELLETGPVLEAETLREALGEALEALTLKETLGEALGEAVVVANTLESAAGAVLENDDVTVGGAWVETPRDVAFF